MTPFTPGPARTPVRFLTSITVSAALVAALVSCSSGGEAGAGAVTVSGAYGEVTVPENPERVLALSTTDADFIFAAGQTPVAVPAMPQTDAATDGTSIYPWQEDRYPEGAPRLNADTEGLDTEAIAELSPDVIIATAYFGLDEETYRQLSEIAPVVHSDTEANTDPWQEVSRKVATALGDAESADVAVQESEDVLANVRSEHPEFEGLTFNAVISPSSEGVWILCSDEDNLARVMGDFGFRLSDYARGSECDGGKAEVSRELLPHLDADVLWAVPDTADQMDTLNGDQLWEGLPAVQRGSVAVVSKTEGIPFAIGFPSPLSVTWAAEALAPRIADAAAAVPA